MSRSDGIGTCSRILLFAHVLVGEPASTSPEHALIRSREPVPMDLSFAALSVTRPKEHVMLATLNRPAAANAMNTQLGTEIMTLFEALNLDAGDTRCVVLT